jgi:hypothetical protein
MKYESAGVYFQKENLGRKKHILRRVMGRELATLCIFDFGSLRFFRWVEDKEWWARSKPGPC